MWAAGPGHAGLRQICLQRRALLRHEADRSAGAWTDVTRPAGNPDRKRNRDARRLPLCESHWQRRNESFELHRVLGLGSRPLQGFSKLTSSAAISTACLGILVESRGLAKRRT